MWKEIKFFQYGHFRRISWSPKVAMVLQRRAMSMNPRYIFVVSYQISSNMVASATAPPVGRVGSFFCVCSFGLHLDYSEIARSFFVFLISERSHPAVGFRVSDPI